MRLATALSFLAFALVSSVSAHPGEEIDEYGTHVRREFLREANRSIANCEQHLRDTGIEAAAVERRAKLARELRSRLGLEQREYINKRDWEEVINTDHESKKKGLTPKTPSKELFGGKLQCVLQAETTVGPYWVRGELIRSNTAEKQPGIPLYTDYQIVDVNTCKPLKDVWLDAWHTNSTGVYSGVVARGNGDISDATNINATFARGLAKTDKHGVAYFQSIFPGHYTGRTHHIHILATHNATVQKNHTITGGHISHVGQVFFDQKLVDEIESLHPYSTNKQPLTTNAQDFIFREEAASMDPVMQYVWLGRKPQDGILAWITIGLDSTKSYNVSHAVDWTKDGGIPNPNAGFPGGPPPSGFPSDFPFPTDFPFPPFPTTSTSA